MAQATVTIREHATVKTNGWGMEEKKSLNQDMVFVNGKLAGYLSYVSKKFLPLAGWPNQHNAAVVEALKKLKGEAFGDIQSVDAPPIAEKLVEVDGDE